MKFWNEVLQHPDYDIFWKERSIEQHLKGVEPAILVVGGTFDTDDCYGALNTYKLIRENSPETDLHFVYGPWTHGGWHEADYDGLGDVMVWDGLSNDFMKNIEYPFFRYYLEGKGKRPEPVYVYASGSDSWQKKEKWPSDQVRYTPLYFQAGSSLAYDASEEQSSSTKYISDPSNPVPHMEDASKKSNTYMVADQAYATKRADVLTFKGDIQSTTLKLQGPVNVDLSLSVSTDDADIIVKLIDVHPDGYHMLVRGEVFPLRYRHSFETPQPVIPGEIVNLKFAMNDIAHWVKPGHRLMVQIQSSWYPLVNLNPQTYMKNIYEAQLEDYRAAEVTIYHQKENQSIIYLPVV